MIGLRGRIEADYRQYGGDDALGADTFDVRRAYFAVEGKFYDDIDFRVRMNFADPNGPTSTVCTAVGVNTSGAPICTATAAARNHQHHAFRRSVVQSRLVEGGANSHGPIQNAV